MPRVAGFHNRVRDLTNHSRETGAALHEPSPHPSRAVHWRSTPWPAPAAPPTGAPPSQLGGDRDPSLLPPGVTDTPQAEADSSLRAPVSLSQTDAHRSAQHDSPPTVATRPPPPLPPVTSAGQRRVSAARRSHWLRRRLAPNQNTADSSPACTDKSNRKQSTVECNNAGLHGPLFTQSLQRREAGLISVPRRKLAPPVRHDN